MILLGFFKDANTTSPIRTINNPKKINVMVNSSTNFLLHIMQIVVKKEPGQNLRKSLKTTFKGRKYTYKGRKYT
jgi:aminoglycoside phosphotransferase family enzyme